MYTYIHVHSYSFKYVCMCLPGNLASLEEGQTQGLCPVSQPSRAPPTLNNKTRAFLSSDCLATHSAICPPPYSLEVCTLRSCFQAWGCEGAARWSLLALLYTCRM